MINNKQFLKGFLEYLQSYYGQQATSFNMGQVPMYPNQPRLSLFQQTALPLPEEMPMGMEQQPAFVEQPMGSMNQQPALPGETLGQELNGMFSGPYDPMRMQ